MRLVGHHETAGNVARYESQLSDALDLYARLGIDSVKTGYVADAGGIRTLGTDGKPRYEWHDGQFMSRHHLKVVTEAAKRHIAVNPHEPIKDTGLRRTYPNWVAREGARGMEYNAWGDPPNPPEHEANLVFTRMLAGPMDFTPGVLSLTGRGGQKFQSTLAKQLALYVVIYSPIQMAADLPENYAKYPGPFQFIRDVPVDWTETKVVAGEIGDSRRSRARIAGAKTGISARSRTIPSESSACRSLSSMQARPTGPRSIVTATTRTGNEIQGPLLSRRGKPAGRTSGTSASHAAAGWRFVSRQPAGRMGHKDC